MDASINEFVVFAGRHPGFLTGILAVVVSLAISKVRSTIIRGVFRIPSVFVRKTYLRRSVGDAVIAHMLRDGWKVKKFVGELYGEDPAFIKSKREVKHVLYRDESSNKQLFFGKGWPILISGSPLIYDKDKARHFEYVAYSLRWASDIVKVLLDAVASKDDREAGDDDEEAGSGFCVKRVSGARFFKEAKGDGSPRLSRDRSMEAVLADPFSSLVPVGVSKDDIGEEAFHNTLENMSLRPELLDVVDEIKFWFNNREWYSERSIPWKKGYLFYGDPGTGKTMLARAIAEELNVPLIIMDLASMTNSDLISAWSQILPKRIVLLEDFDAVFDKRENLLNSDLSFDCILNVMDGADKKEGILTILTTNHPLKLDPALGGPEDEDGVYIPGTKTLKMPTRPGRIDRSVEFLGLDRDGRFKLAMRILRDEELANRLVDEGKNDSAAQLQERACRLAVEVLFKKREEEIAKKTTNGQNGVIPAPVAIPPAP